MPLAAGAGSGLPYRTDLSSWENSTLNAPWPAPRSTSIWSGPKASRGLSRTKRCLPRARPLISRRRHLFFLPTFTTGVLMPSMVSSSGPTTFLVNWNSTVPAGTGRPGTMGCGLPQARPAQMMQAAGKTILRDPLMGASNP